jgi:hypothetical protein
MIKSIIIWSWLVSTGYIVPMNAEYEGRELYTFYMAKGKTARYAYKKEILMYIKKRNWKFLERIEKAKKRK